MNLAQWLRLVPRLEREFDNNDVETFVERLLKSRYRADLVAELPTNAPRGYLLVTAGDPFLYIGTGMTTPLRRIPTQAV